MKFLLHSILSLDGSFAKIKAKLYTSSKGSALSQTIPIAVASTIQMGQDLSLVYIHSFLADPACSRSQTHHTGLTIQTRQFFNSSTAW